MPVTKEARTPADARRRQIARGIDRWLEMAGMLEEHWGKVLREDPGDEIANKWVNRHGLLAVRLIAEQRQWDAAEAEATAKMTEGDQREHLKAWALAELTQAELCDLAERKGNA